MKPIPETENPRALRTDYSNEAVWEKIRALIQQRVGLFRFQANMDFEEFAKSVDEDGIFRGFPQL